MNRRGIAAQLPRRVATAIVAALVVASLVAPVALGAKPASGECVVKAGGITYASVQAALDASAAGVKVTVSGTCVGPVVVSKDASISGPGGHTLSATLDGDLARSAVTVDAGATLTLSRIIVTNGSQPSGGGGILNNGTLIVKRSRVADNASSLGGGLANFGDALVVNSTFDHNGGNRGGNIYNAGTLVVKGSDLVDGLGRFGQSLWNDGTAALIRTNVSDNHSALSPLSGGGIQNGGDLTLIGSTVSDNSAVFGAGILNTGTTRLIRSSVSGNGGASGGGGVLNGPMFGPGSGTEHLILIDSDVTGNDAFAGGGIYNKGDIQLDRRSRIGGNTATGGQGGGIFNEAGATVTGIRGATFTPPNTPDDCFGC